MANRLFNPNEQYCDSTGLPYAGGSLTFYASGTTTPLNTYSNSTLTIANTNPIILDSAGRANSVFLQNLAYKVVLEDVNNNVIWTMDPVYASDFSTVAQFQSGSGSPNGALAGTAGSPTIPASAYWDSLNDILYVCTQTGTTSTAVWTAINSGSTSSVVAVPQGYLTPTSATPVIPSDVTAATNVFYTPYVGNLIPIYNGTSFTTTVFGELNLSLSSLSANGIYDVFVFNNAGVVTICSGPSWSNVTAGSCARGTGAGTTQLSRVNGIWVNSVQISAKNGSNSYTVPANQATYVGSLIVDGIAGQVSCYRSWGQSRKWGVWNAYNRQTIILQAGDSTATWLYSTATIRQSNASTGNTIQVFSGLPEEEVHSSFKQKMTYLSAAGTSLGAGMIIGIGLNSTTAFSGTQGTLNVGALGVSGGATTTATLQGTATAEYIVTPFIGINNINSLEEAIASGGQSLFGTQGNMSLTARWRG